MMARPRRGTSLFRVSAVGAGPLARDFDRASRELQNVIIRELRRSALRVTDVVREAAPKDSGDLADQLDTRLYFRAGEPRFTVVSPVERDGYPYTAVTRFGHRKAIIRPRTARALTVHGPRHASVVRYASAVRGVGHGSRHVPHDWVGEAMPFVNDEIERAGARIGRSMTTTTLPGRRTR